MDKERPMFFVNGNSHYCTKIVTQILVDDFMQGILPPSYTRFLVKPLSTSEDRTRALFCCSNVGSPCSQDFEPHLLEMPDALGDFSQLFTLK